MDKIRIETGDISLAAELNGSDTAISIYNMLPLSGTANIWGDEVYFSIPVHMEEAQDARQEVGIGDLGFCGTLKAPTKAGDRKQEPRPRQLTASGAGTGTTSAPGAASGVRQCPL